jgi:hypothetical protein
VLTLLAMGIAAAVFTSGLSLAQGTARLAFWEYRAYYGGEIMVFSPGFIGAAPVDPTSTNPISERILNDSGFNQLLRLYPGFRTAGYLAEDQWRYTPLGSDRVTALSHLPGVVDVFEHRVMPASVGLRNWILRRPPEEYLRYIVEGQSATLSMQGEIRGVVNSYTFEGPTPDVGSVVEVLVPRFLIDADGIPYADYSSPGQTYEVKVVGKVSWPTRQLAWSEGEGTVRSEQAYVHSPELYLTETSWQAIWAAQSAGAAYPVTSVSLRVTDMSNLNVITTGVQAQNPDMAVFSVPTVASHVERYGLLDRFYEAPSELWMPQDDIQPYAPREFGLTTAILLYLNAGMLLASQMLASVASRRKEIGILKAIGSRNREVVGMILIEAVFLAVVGASLGFALVRIAGIHQAVTNQMGLINILLGTIREMTIVVGVTAFFSLLFGVLPAWRVARMTVMDVFRNE